MLARAADAIALVRRHGGHIGYLRAAFEDADYDAIPPTSRMGRRVQGTGRAFHNDSPPPPSTTVITVAQLDGLLSAS